jgi:tetratricopeptide (TPR) repeat protein
MPHLMPMTISRGQRVLLITTLVALTSCRTLGSLNPLQGTVGGALLSGAVTLLVTKDTKIAAIAATIGGIAGCYLVTEFGQGASDEERNRPEFKEAKDKFDSAVEEIKRKEEAIDMFIQRLEDANSLHPRPETYQNLAVARIQQGQLEEACRLLHCALALDPNYTPSQNTLESLRRALH